MAEYDKSISGFYTSTGAAKTLNLPFIPDWFELRIQGNSSGDNWISSANPGVPKEVYWYSGMANDSALITKNTDGAATDTKLYVSSNGIQTFQSSPNSFAAPLTINTGISQANPAVVTLGSTAGLANGDTVIVYGSTGMLQIAGLPFTIAALSTNVSFTLAYLNSSGFAAPATAGFVKKVLYPNVFLPQLRYITAITQAASAVITFSTTHGFVVGETLRLHVPANFGMIQADGQLVTVTAINTGTNTITVNLNTSAFTAFAFPTSAIASKGTSFPTAVPVGEQASQFDSSFTDNGAQGVILGTSVVGANGALVLWKAAKVLKVYNT